MLRRWILFITPADTSRHKSSANTAIYPNLGLLALMSTLASDLSRSDIQLGYLDGVVLSNSVIETFITDNASSIAVLCFSVLTSNYGSALELAGKAKALNKHSVTIFGNDHCSSRYGHIMKHRSVIDYGFCGNDCRSGLCGARKGLTFSSHRKRAVALSGTGIPRCIATGLQNSRRPNRVVAPRSR